MHPFVLHQPGVPHSMPPQFPQSHAPSESLQIATQTEPPSSQNDQNLINQMQSITMKLLLMGNHFIKTIWMFKFAKGQSLNL
ncbi:hypothetical protein RchiOBHm_Chr1g0382591 [Rosa chinensis]|uniref:Uncharacterized protein n=1 Tax=Rosa chinensis TaxID=74649 RepID=A0A2P6SPG8_ROSCH|nr:hypothetical protein RchiOBHm_Chr1g0382591 [Rosa chinensis]